MRRHIAFTVLILSVSIISVTLLFTLPGCGSGNEALTATTTSDTQESLENTKEEEAEDTNTILPEKQSENISAKSLDIHVWEGYLPEKVIDMFEQETGIKLNITLTADNGTMITLLEGGGKADIIMPTQNQVNRLYEQNLALPLDL